MTEFRHPNTPKRLHNKGCNPRTRNIRAELWRAVYDKYGFRCQHCGDGHFETDYQIDHIVPIAKGGLTTIENLQVLCAYCNAKKGARFCG